MTLIIASARFSESLLVADRQLSSPQGARVDAEAYKIVYYVNSEQLYACAVALTGLATVGGRPTVDWLMNTLPAAMDAKTSLSYAIESLKDVCNAEIVPHLRGIRRRHRALTFVLCGRYMQFHRTTSKTRHAPFLTLVTNSAGDRGRQLEDVADGFSAYSAWPSRPSKGIAICRGDLHSAGSFTPQLHDLFRYLRRAIPYAAKVKLAAQYVSLVARKSKWVGETVLGLAIHKLTSAEAFDYTIYSGKQIKTMPHVVFASGGRARNFRVEPL